jgi:hypothetical protein
MLLHFAIVLQPLFMIDLRPRRLTCDVYCLCRRASWVSAAESGSITHTRQTISASRDTEAFEKGS